MRVSSRAIAIKENQLLVEVSGEICFPLGGRLELDETPKEALERELKEEIPSANFEIQRYLGKIFNRWEEKGEIIESEDHYFLVTWLDANLEKAIVSGEADRTFLWIKLMELENEKLMPAPLRDLISKINSATISEWNFHNDEVG